MLGSGELILFDAHYRSRVKPVQRSYCYEGLAWRLIGDGDREGGIAWGGGLGGDNGRSGWGLSVVVVVNGVVFVLGKPNHFSCALCIRSRPAKKSTGSGTLVRPDALLSFPPFCCVLGEYCRCGDSDLSAISALELPLVN